MTDQFEWEKPENRLDFQVINQEFETLVKGTINRVDREWPTDLGIGEWYSIYLSFPASNTAAPTIPAR